MDPGHYPPSHYHYIWSCWHLFANLQAPTYIAYNLSFTKFCGPWSVFATTVHAFVNEFTASPAGWRRSQKPGSIRPAHGELPSQVGVLEFISHKSYSWKIILQETFLDKYQMFFFRPVIDLSLCFSTSCQESWLQECHLAQRQRHKLQPRCDTTSKF